MQSNRLTMITLAVTDLTASRKFYAALGWHEEEGGNEAIAFFRLQQQFFALYLRDKLEDDLDRPVPAPATGAITLAQNFPDNRAVDQAFAHAVASGATVVAAPKETFWGGYSGYFSDPDGHLWEYACNPFWPLDENGLLEKTS